MTIANNAHSGLEQDRSKQRLTIRQGAKPMLQPERLYKMTATGRKSGYLNFRNGIQLGTPENTVSLRSSTDIPRTDRSKEFSYVMSACVVI